MSTCFFNHADESHVILTFASVVMFSQFQAGLFDAIHNIYCYKIYRVFRF